MVEVFRTNVAEPGQANMLLAQIHQKFNSYQANFDLEDCDKILRVQNADGYIPPSPLIKLLNTYGFEAEVLPED